jgi:UDP-N-acetyl-D-glucosamine dehydrogenase
MTEHLVVIGLGYVGLPLVQQSISRGLQVTGLDVNQSVVDQLNAGVSHVDDLSDDEVARMLELGFKATTDPSVLASADVAVICVPTPLSPQGGPDLAAVESATGLVAEHLHEEMLVVLESTTYPGTTEEIVKPALEEASGLVCGQDFNLAFSPERVDPGNPSYGIGNTPKVVGGVTSRCTERARDFYARFVDTVVPARGTREAEMAKLLENTYRHINIALVNEMARFCHELDIDLWDVISCASTKPFGFQPFFPGPGVGGHCIPIDPNYLSYQVNQKLGYPFRFVELAEEINSSMPVYVAQRLRDLLKEDNKSIEGSRILLLGVTYKPNIGDQRESPAVPLARELEAWGATVEFHDPFVEKWDLPDRTVDRVQDLEQAMREADVTALLQNHADYDLDFIGATASRLFDTRGVVRTDGVYRL